MNIAEIGFRAPTGDLKNAKVALDALVPSAQKAEKATENFNRAAAGVTAGTGGASAGIKSFSAAAMGAAAGTDRLSKAALSSGTAMGTVQRAAVGASATLGNLVQTTARVGMSFANADAHVTAYKASLAGVTPAANNAASSLNRLGAAANDNINRLQSTPGNIAAQFQDIGVTAAGGMSPMLIALQQGTQLSSAMAGGLGNVVAGFAQLFSVTSIVTIGLVGLAAAGLQSVDWMGLAQTVMRGLADAMDTVSVAAAYLGVVMAIAFAPQIITWIGTTTAMLIGGLLTAIKSVTLAMIAFAIANPFGFIVLAIGLVIGAMVLLNDTFGGVFTDAINWVKKAANFIIGALVGAFNAVKATWKMLPAAIGDYAIQAANWVLKTVEGMVNGTISLINGMVAGLPFGLGEGLQMGDVSFGEIANPLAGSADKVDGMISAEMGKAQGVDYVQGMIDGVQSMGSWAAGKLRGWADALGLDPKDAKKKAGAGKSGMSELEKIAKAYEDLIASTEKRITALKVETTALGMSTNAAMLYRNQQDLIAQALEKNIPLTDTVRIKLNELAQALTNAELAKATAEATRAFEDQQRALKDQADLIGLTGLELAYTAERQKLVNDAVSSGVIDLNNMTDAMREYVAVLGERAMLLARGAQGNAQSSFISDMTKSHEEGIYALQRERGEIGLIGKALQAYRYETDMLLSARQKGLELGPQDVQLIRDQAVEYSELSDSIAKTRERIEFFRGAHRSFFSEMIGGLREGQTVWQSFGNAVMSVVNRIIDRLLSMNGGILDKLVGLGSSLFGLAAPQASLVGSVNGAMNENPSIFAKGGTFGVEKFAQGGAFTNGIYSKPTLFKFAGGGALGEMGEAGPEAVMPLKRGPNGSLGVEMHRSEPVRVVVTTNDDRFDAYVDERSEGAVARGAPAIAAAGGQVGMARAAFTRSRTIGGR